MLIELWIYYLVDLSDLCDGSTLLRLDSAVHPSPRIGKHLSKGSIIQGNYFESATTFSIEIQTEFSLRSTAEQDGEISPHFSTVIIACK